jgi:hypothetical protein
MLLVPSSLFAAVLHIGDGFGLVEQIELVGFVATEVV